MRRSGLAKSFGSRKLPPSGPERALAGATVAEGFLASCAMAPSSHGALRWKGFEKYVHRESCEHGPQPYLQRQQVCIIGLWGEKSDDDLLQFGRKESCFLFAVGANGELCEVSGLRFLHCRAWMRKAAKKDCESEFFFLVQWDSWHSSWVWTAAAAALKPTVDESGDALLPAGEAADKHGALGAAADGGKGAAGGAGEIVGPIKLPWAAGGQGGAVGAGEIDGRLMLPWDAGGHGGADSAGEIVGCFAPLRTAGGNGCGDITRAQPCSLELYWTASGDGGDDGWAPWPAGALEASDGRPADVRLPAPPLGLRPQPESETPELLLAGVFPENYGERTQGPQEAFPKNNGERTRKPQDAIKQPGKEPRELRPKTGLFERPPQSLLATSAAMGPCMCAAVGQCRGSGTKGEPVRRYEGRRHASTCQMLAVAFVPGCRDAMTHFEA